MRPSASAIQEAASALESSVERIEIAASMIDELSAILLSINKFASELSVVPRLCSVALWMCENITSKSDDDLEALREHIKTLRASAFSASTAA